MERNNIDAKERKRGGSGTSGIVDGAGDADPKNAGGNGGNIGNGGNGEVGGDGSNRGVGGNGDVEGNSENGGNGAAIGRAGDRETRGDRWYEGRDELFMDIDRMINEGLGGGRVTIHNGFIEESSTDTMRLPESVLDDE